MHTEIFDNAKEIISSVIDTIEDINNLYSQKSPCHNQKSKHINNGLVKIRNIFVPINGIYHRVLFETVSSIQLPFSISKRKTNCIVLFPSIFSNLWLKLDNFNKRKFQEILFPEGLYLAFIKK